MTSVLVAYLHPGGLSHSFASSMDRMRTWDATHQQRLVAPLMMRCGSGGLIEARNLCMVHFLGNTDAEWLFMVDSDMGFRPDTVDRLIAVADPDTRPVVGGLCFALREVVDDGYNGFKVRPVPTLYRWAQTPHGETGYTPIYDYPRDTLVQVAGTGAACLLIHRSAVEAVFAEYQTWFDRLRYPSGRWISEDLSFCSRLGTLGIPVHVHTGVRTTHHKQFWVGEDEYDMWQQHFTSAGPVVSALLPSRGRPDSLRKSIGSLLDRAGRPELVEILVAADPDDDDTVKVAEELGCQVLVADERYGYARLHEYFNRLADQATGEWLLLWNDDATVETDDWLMHLATLPDEVLVADLQSQHSPKLCCFPAVRRRAVEAVGGFSPHTPHADTYWQQVGRATRTISPVNVRVFHDRDDITGGHQDQTRAEGKAAYQTDEFFSPPVQTLIAEDVEKIRGLR